MRKVIVQLQQVANLAPKGRSGVTPEDEHEGLVARCSQADDMTASELGKFNRRNRVTNIETVRAAICRDGTDHGCLQQRVLFGIDISEITFIDPLLLINLGRICHLDAILLRSMIDGRQNECGSCLREVAVRKVWQNHERSSSVVGQLDNRSNDPCRVNKECVAQDNRRTRLYEWSKTDCKESCSLCAAKVVLIPGKAKSVPVTRP